MPQQHELERLTDPSGPGLWHRYPGRYRAQVVETNDPLGMHRIRFRLPEMHNFDTPTDKCPWATIATSLGGKRATEWRSPCIGDWVWIDFEKDHAYGPVVSGFADPTRRKFYSLPSVYARTPLPVDDHGHVAEQPEDFNEEYLPKDGRPMSQGTQDRYGNLDLMSATGFYPVEHKDAPPSPGYDPIQRSDFSLSRQAPKVNDPDQKMMVRISKYGHVMLMGDQGYHWMKGDEAGEFYGDHTKDEKFEVARWLYLQRLLSEDKPTGHDQRRIEFLSRYGHKFEMRDIGWAQDGPVKSKSRQGEYGSPTTLSKETERDERWIKIRTKGGHVFQMFDTGSHPGDDEYIKRLLVDEVGDKADGEADWKGKDARQMRMVTRHGYKMVLDDRGSDSKKAHSLENPCGNGILLKGRRSPGSQGIPSSGDARGYFWEFNENDGINQTTWGSPLGNICQINDKHQYIMLASRKADYPTKWQGLKENEFLLDALVKGQAEDNLHHFKIDHHNEYLAIKTRVGKGDAPLGEPVNPPPWDPKAEDYVPPVNQGLEARDGSMGDGVWTELVDAGGRNLWFWDKGKLIMCHARDTPDQIKIMWWMNEESREFVLRHDEDSGRLQIFSNKSIEIISNEAINMYAKGAINIKSDDRVVLSSAATSVEIGDHTKSTQKVEAPDFPTSTPSVSGLENPSPAEVPQLSPTDRGRRYNDKLDESPSREEIEHNVDN